MCMWSGGSCEDNPYHRHHHHPFGGGNNCSVPDWDNATGTFNLGTLEDYRHLMLAAVRWWNQTLVQGLVPTMARMSTLTTKLPGRDGWTESMLMVQLLGGQWCH